MVFLRMGEVERSGSHVVNLIHYEDAANLCLKVPHESILLQLAKGFFDSQI